MGLKTGLITSTLHTPNNFETKPHLEKMLAWVFTKVSLGSKYPTLSTRVGPLSSVLYAKVLSVFRFLLKEVRNVLM